MKLSLHELALRQQWSLEQKIDHSIGVIEQYVSYWGGVEHVYVSFSGGKDSTVLLDLCRTIFPDMLAVFCSTGCEYPEIIKFVNSYRKQGNCEVIHPKYTPKQVWAKYGFPLVSKEVAKKIKGIRNDPNSPTSKKDLEPNNKFGLATRWRYLIDEPYDSHYLCCHKLKKEPFRKYEKVTGRKPIIGVMASESLLRANQWVRHGCNIFEGHVSSRPLSIWTEEDIWEYINTRGLEVAELYHKGIYRTGCAACGFGCHYEDDKRFEILKELHPRYYDMVMNFTNNGVTFREAIRKQMAVNGLYLPDERPIPPEEELATIKAKAQEIYGCADDAAFLELLEKIFGAELFAQIGRENELND
jgi:3'-phosphoadenosine 5'-phosphosulfate sulfotransferase (PAPS reductase)/FAD synthetase